MVITDSHSYFVTFLCCYFREHIIPIYFPKDTLGNESRVTLNYFAFSFIHTTSKLLEVSYICQLYMSHYKNWISTGIEIIGKEWPIINILKFFLLILLRWYKYITIDLNKIIFNFKMCSTTPIFLYLHFGDICIICLIFLLKRFYYLIVWIKFLSVGITCTYIWSI